MYTDDITLKEPNHLPIFSQCTAQRWPVDHLTEEVDPSLAKQPFDFNGGLAKFGSTSLVKQAIGNMRFQGISENAIDLIQYINIFNTTIADDLPMQGARASTAMVLI